MHSEDSFMEEGEINKKKNSRRTHPIPASYPPVEQALFLSPKVDLYAYAIISMKLLKVLWYGIKSKAATAIISSGIFKFFSCRPKFQH